MYRKRFWWKWWYNLICHSTFAFRDWRISKKKKSVKIAAIRADILKRGLTNMNQGLQPLGKTFSICVSWNGNLNVKCCDSSTSYQTTLNLCSIQSTKLVLYLTFGLIRLCSVCCFHFYFKSNSQSEHQNGISITPGYTPNVNDRYPMKTYE
jgi:hypothetical protein